MKFVYLKPFSPPTLLPEENMIFTWFNTGRALKFHSYIYMTVGVHYTVNTPIFVVHCKTPHSSLKE